MTAWWHWPSNAKPTEIVPNAASGEPHDHSAKNLPRQRCPSAPHLDKALHAGFQNPGQPLSKQTTRTSRQAYRPDSVFLPVEPRPAAPATQRKMKGTTTRQAFGVSSPTITQRTGTRSKGNPTHRTIGAHQGRMVKDSHRQGYDFAFSLGRTAVRAPLLSLPNLGPRWVSAGLTLILGMLLYTMVTANTFKVSTLEVTGNQRLVAEDVSARLDLTGQPIFNVVPSRSRMICAPPSPTWRVSACRLASPTTSGWPWSNGCPSWPGTRTAIPPGSTPTGLPLRRAAMSRAWCRSLPAGSRPSLARGSENAH